MHTFDFHLHPRGAFSLRAADSFGFGSRVPAPWDGRMRLALVVDGFKAHAFVVLTQDDGGVVHGRAQVTGEVDHDVVTGQVARILSLDLPGDGWDQLGQRDALVGALQKRYPGMRPVLFNSPYEGGAWSILSMRQARPQARRVLAALCASAGTTLELEGRSVSAFPLPERLLSIGAVPGLAATKLDRLKGLARAALDGRLDPARLRSGDPESLMEDLQEIPGVGPFTAGLMLIRAAGVTDVLPTSDARLLKHASRLGGGAIRDHRALVALAEHWRPFRTWVAVLIRVDENRSGDA